MCINDRPTPYPLWPIRGPPGRPWAACGERRVLQGRTRRQGGTARSPTCSNCSWRTWSTLPSCSLVGQLSFEALTFDSSGLQPDVALELFAPHGPRMIYVHVWSGKLRGLLPSKPKATPAEHGGHYWRAVDPTFRKARPEHPLSRIHRCPCQRSFPAHRITFSKWQI